MSKNKLITECRNIYNQLMSHDAPNGLKATMISTKIRQHLSKTDLPELCYSLDYDENSIILEFENGQKNKRVYRRSI